jgi:hypothetical protein
VLLLARLRFLRAPTGSSVLHSSYSAHFLLPHPSSGSASLVLLRLVTASRFDGLLLLPVPTSSASASSASCSHANVHHAASDPSSRSCPHTALPCWLWPFWIGSVVTRGHGLCLVVLGARRAVRPIGSRVASGCAPFLMDVDRIRRTRLFLFCPLPVSSASCFVHFLLRPLSFFRFLPLSSSSCSSSDLFLHRLLLASTHSCFI